MGFIGILLTLLAGIVALGTVATLLTGHHSAQYLAYCLSSVCCVFVTWLIWFAVYAASISAQIPIGVSQQSKSHAGATAQQGNSREALDSVVHIVSSTPQIAEQAQEAKPGQESGDRSDHATEEHEAAETESGLRYIEVFGGLALAFAIAYFAFIQSEVSKRAADVASDQWKSMEAQNTLMKNQMGQTDKQIDFAQQQLEQAKSASTQTDQMIEQMRLEQRAWLGTSNPEISAFVPGERAKITVPILNSGKTPAAIEHMEMAAMIADANDPKQIGFTFKAFAGATGLIKRENTVPPGGRLNFNITDAPVLKQADIDEITKVDGKQRLWIIGIAAYRDVTKARRVTMCCYYYDPITKGPMGYGKYNYMD